MRHCLGETVTTHVQVNKPSMLGHRMHRTWNCQLVMTFLFTCSLFRCRYT